LLANAEKMLEYNRNLSAAKNSGQDSLFSLAPALAAGSTITLASAPPASKRDILNWERELLGLYISDHPFNEYEKILGASVIPIAQLNKTLEGQLINAAGVIAKIKKIVTKNNDNMLFVKIEDKTASVELLVFPSLLKETADVWQEGNAVICRGRLSNKENEIKLLVDKAKKIEPEIAVKLASEFLRLNKNNGFKNINNNVSAPAAPILKIKIKDLNNQELLARLKERLAKNPGAHKVYFYIPGESGLQVIETGFRVDASEELKKQLAEIAGEDAVK